MPYVVDAWAHLEADTSNQRDQGHEAAFRRWYRETTLPRTRTALMLSAIIITGISAVDLALLPQAAPLTALVRAVIMLPALLLMVMSLDRPALRPWSEAILFGGIVLVGWSSIAVGAIDARNGLPPVHTPGLVLVLIYAYQFIGLSFRLTLGAAGLITAAYFAAILAAGAPAYAAFVNMLFVAGANAVGAVQCHANWQAGRNTYRQTLRMREHAMRDALTSVANRRAIEQHSAALWLEMQRRHGALGIYMVDIDCFKQFNDTYGHQAGDECLRRVAACLSGVVRRPLDMVGRFGGEEFVVILADPRHSYVHLAAERICEAVSGLNQAHASSPVAGHVTVSVGATCVRPGVDCDSIADAIQLADQALYEAKDQGRDRYVFRYPVPAESAVTSATPHRSTDRLTSAGI
ncbi:MAG: GGDEF domain-containing protein [Gammaproteobacteria bacterium]|nr:GGDEF domain-containing protein [Gammaproteobacteria bacterium]NNL99215.1 GGDEF domain-containing protein [Gammaproteobacteria bacterium]